MNVSPLEFSNYLDYLASLRVDRRTGRPVSMRQWSSRLGYKSPRTISLVMNRERLPSEEFIDRVSERMELSPKEHRYLQLLVKLERAKRGKRNTAAIADKLRTMGGKAKTRVIDAELANLYFSKWYHPVLKMLVSCPSFKENGDWLVGRLGGRVGKTEIKKAIERLIDLKIFRRDATGRLQTFSERTMTSSDIANETLREFLLSMAQRAIEALLRDPVEDREFDSSTIKVDRSRINEVKADIRKFRNEFIQKYHDPESDHVFQLNLQFFEHRGDK